MTTGSAHITLCPAYGLTCEMRQTFLFFTSCLCLCSTAPPSQAP